jgi:hypothetical protein
VVAAGAAEEDRQLVAADATAAAGEDRGRLIKRALYHWLLLAESQLTRRLVGTMVRRISALPMATG